MEVQKALEEFGTVKDVDMAQMRATLKGLDADIGRLTQGMAFRSDLDIDLRGFLEADKVTTATFDAQVAKRRDIVRALQETLNTLPDMRPNDDELATVAVVDPTGSPALTTADAVGMMD